MTKNPFINALAAMAYIAAIATFMYYAPKFAGQATSAVIPMAMLSLFTLSVAFMGYCFFYQPLRLYLDGEKKKGANLFLQTLAVFAGVTFLFFALIFLGVLQV